MSNLKFSILIPTYNGARGDRRNFAEHLIPKFPKFRNYCPGRCVDRIILVEVIKAFNDPRIKIFKNEKNLGYPGNLESLSKKATGDIMYLMGQDDILGRARSRKHIKLSKFRMTSARWRGLISGLMKKSQNPCGRQNNSIPKKMKSSRITDDFEKIILTIDVAGQLSGLAMRRKYLDTPFHKDIFPCHVYPFAAILKKHPIVFLKDYNVAVRIRSSQCRSVSSIYDKSPIESWVDFFNNIFPGKEFERIPKICDQKLRREKLCRSGSDQKLREIQIFNS